MEPYNPLENVNHPAENGTYDDERDPMMICSYCNKPLNADNRVLVGEFSYAHRECRDARDKQREERDKVLAKLVAEAEELNLGYNTEKNT